VTWAIEEKSYSQRRACALVGLHPRTYRYASTRPDDTALRAKLQDLASQRRRFGYRRLGLNVLMVGRKCERPSLPEHHQLLWEFLEPRSRSTR
jgi:putative transposase